MDYIVELVKGYFVTTALYLQAENLDVTHASFSNVIFYLDTPAVIGASWIQVLSRKRKCARDGQKLAA